MSESPKDRLEYLRGCIHAESISYGELAELQNLAEHIEPGDVELLEWAGVPEFPEDAHFKTAEHAAAFIGTLPDHEDGRYFLDGPEH